MKITSRTWGYYEVLDQRGVRLGKTLLGQVCLKYLHILPGKNISYQRHFHRAESWTILSGSGLMVLDKKIFAIQPGETITIPRGEWHSVYSSELILISETQYGAKTEETDIERLFTDWKDIERHCADAITMQGESYV